MLLCLDAGNSRLKYGLHDAGRWRAHGAIDHAALDDLPARLPHAPRRIVACNVAGAASAARIAALAARLAVPLDWLESGPAACGVTSGYDNPRQLGADRWAALIGARALHAGAAVVVMAGTATTIDALDATGRFRGGLILPGLGLMRSTLAENTAGLPQARGRYRELATNTDDAIASGALHATFGAIARVRASLGGEASCLLSGGAADELAARIPPPLVRIEYLVLEGLARYGDDRAASPLRQSSPAAY